MKLKSTTEDNGTSHIWFGDTFKDGFHFCLSSKRIWGWSWFGKGFTSNFDDGLFYPSRTIALGYFYLNWLNNKKFIVKGIQ